MRKTGHDVGDHGPSEEQITLTVQRREPRRLAAGGGHRQERLRRA